MRSTFSAVAFALAAFAFTSSADAQTFGIGARFSMIRGDVDADTSAERFLGVLVRLRTSDKTSLEVSLDRRAETNEAATERTRDYPLQASLLLFPVRSAISPYLLGGVGWYSHRFERLEGDDVIESTSTRKFGYHAGFGGELSLGRHAGLHADYRYTFLRFGSDDDEESTSSRFLPSYQGSMWTAGLTLYF
jgi:opacity protein-like surface antigen